jgi:predicted MFS family arabinose efflux permease
MRSALLSAFFAAASVGSVLGVLLGGVIAARWGWKAAFGVVGIPGLLLALLYLFVRDYRTVDLTPQLTRATHTPRNALKHIIGVLARTRTLLWVCAGAAVQLIVVSAVWAWLPSYLNRVHGIAPDQAAIKAALVVLCGAVGTVVWGAVADRCGAVRARMKLHAVAVICVATTLVLLPTFGAHAAGIALAPQAQFALIALGGFLMTCSVGPASAVVMDVAHRACATGAAVLSLFQNLFGLAIGPFLAGALSDAFGLESELTAISVLGIVSALLFVGAARSYESDMQRFGEVRVESGSADAGAHGSTALEEVR